MPSAAKPQPPAESPEKTERKKPKWSGATLHKRRRKALLKNASQRVTINRSRMKQFTRQQTIKLLRAKGEERNKDIYTQDFGKVTRCGAKATDLMAQIMEKHISQVMGKLRANAAHAGRKTVKTSDLQLL